MSEDHRLYLDRRWSYRLAGTVSAPKYVCKNHETYPNCNVKLVWRPSLKKSWQLNHEIIFSKFGEISGQTVTQSLSYLCSLSLSQSYLCQSQFQFLSYLCHLAGQPAPATSRVSLSLLPAGSTYTHHWLGQLQACWTVRATSHNHSPVGGVISATGLVSLPLLPAGSAYPCTDPGQPTDWASYGPAEWHGPSATTISDQDYGNLWLKSFNIKYSKKR